MIDDTWKRNEVDSPCVNICVIHQDAKICVGCHRTADEITRWSTMGDEARQLVKDALPGRGPSLRNRRGGRAARRRQDVPKL